MKRDDQKLISSLNFYKIIIISNNIEIVERKAYF